jgi:hypothetical protein
MNGKIKCVKNQGNNGECMHMKCKYVIIVEWNNLARIKLISTIWQPSCGEFFSIFNTITNLFLQLLLFYYK